MVEPKGDNLEKVATQLLPALRVTPDYVIKPVRFIYLTFRLSNWATRPVSGPCWPEVCVSEPAPSTINGLEWTIGLPVDDLQKLLEGRGGRFDRDGLTSYYGAKGCGINFDSHADKQNRLVVDFAMVMNERYSDILLYPDAIACLKQNGLYRPPSNQK